QPMLQAGDLAPELVLTKIMRSPGDAVWRHENLLGRITLLVFFSNVSDTTEAFASLWNGLVQRFADILAGRVAKTRLRAKPYSLGGDKPDLPPSYTVHISL